jgi:thymidine phosphorylase
MPTLDRAEELGRSLETVGASLGLNVNCLITDMNQPLGRAVGNSLEVCEAIDTLAGNGPEDLLELSVRLAAEMVLMAGLEDDLETARARVERALMSGDGLKVLREMIEAQDGDPRVIDDRGLLPTATHSYKLTAQSDGFVTFQNCRAVGMAAAVLGGHKGGGRPNPGAGLLVDVRHGDQVNSGAPLVEILYDDEAQRGEAEVLLRRAIAVSPDRPKPWPLIYDRLPARSD